MHLQLIVADGVYNRAEVGIFSLHNMYECTGKYTLSSSKFASEKFIDFDSQNACTLNINIKKPSKPRDSTICLDHK